MPIVSSSYTVDATAQADGRSWVYETHVDHNGIEHKAEYLATPEFDIEHCLSVRAANIGAEVDRREAAEAEACNFTVSLSKLQFLARMTMAERVACRTLAKTDPIAEDFMAMLDLAQSIRPGHPDLLAGLGYMESQGALASGRAAEIGGA